MSNERAIVPNEVRELLLRLDDAFREVPRPRITKNVARGWDDDWVLSDERARELTALDPENDWREVTAEDTEKFQEYFSFSDAEGWSFYLPAYIKHDLLRYPYCGANAVYWACLERERLAHLSGAQLACIDDYLRVVHSESNELKKLQ